MFRMEHVPTSEIDQLQSTDHYERHSGLDPESSAVIYDSYFGLDSRLRGNDDAIDEDTITPSCYTTMDCVYLGCIGACVKPKGG